MKKIFIFAAAIIALGSCQSLKEEFQPVFTGEYDDPAAEQPVSMEATHTIAELAARYTPGRPWTIDENIALMRTLAPRRGYVTHSGHRVEYGQLADYLPDFMEPAYDGLLVEL